LLALVTSDNISFTFAILFSSSICKLKEFGRVIVVNMTSLVTLMAYKAIVMISLTLMALITPMTSVSSAATAMSITLIGIGTRVST
jgi:hypothetical protein